jgi:hypothetical protein
MIVTNPKGFGVANIHQDQNKISKFIRGNLEKSLNSKKEPKGVSLQPKNIVGSSKYSTDEFIDKIKGFKLTFKSHGEDCFHIIVLRPKEDNEQDYSIEKTKIKETCYVVHYVNAEPGIDFEMTKGATLFEGDKPFLMIFWTILPIFYFIGKSNYEELMNFDTKKVRFSPHLFYLWASIFTILTENFVRIFQIFITEGTIRILALFAAPLLLAIPFAFWNKTAKVKILPKCKGIFNF